MDGVVGVRAVITDGTTFGVSSVCLLNDHGTPLDTRDDTCDISLTPRREKQDYVDILPNASMRIRFTPKLQLRLGYTRTRTKPDFSALNPALTITPVIYAACLAPTNPNYNPSDTLSCRSAGSRLSQLLGSAGQRCAAFFLRFRSGNKLLEDLLRRHSGEARRFPIEMGLVGIACVCRQIGHAGCRGARARLRNR